MFKLFVLAAILAFAAALPAPGPFPGPEAKPVAKPDPLLVSAGYVAPSVYTGYSPYVAAVPSYTYSAYSAPLVYV